jgi:dipeptidyl aminopeptidase/acylaminoacyl peptidase
VQYFASIGYGVLQINYRGSAGYGISHIKQGLEGELAGTIIDDIVDGTRFMIDKGFADPERVVIMGGSFGGYATYMSLIRYPNLFKAGIAVAAIAHWKNMVRTDKQYGFHTAYEFWDEIISRSEDPDYDRQISPYYHAAKIVDPVLIIHGRWDGTVFYEQAEMMERALKKENKVVKLVKFPESGHSFIGTKKQSRYLEEIRLFLEEHI